MSESRRHDWLHGTDEAKERTVWTCAKCGVTRQWERSNDGLVEVYRSGDGAIKKRLKKPIPCSR
jgi:hypothetical protein